MTYDTYYGPFTISQVEQCVGDFSYVWMKPGNTSVIHGPNGERLLYAVGCVWDCGCDVRGPSYDMIRTSRWSPCAKHAHFVRRIPQLRCDVPEDLRGGELYRRRDVTMRVVFETNDASA